MKNLCLILLTVFFICKSTDVTSLLLTDVKIMEACTSDNCDCEKAEIEKLVDDKQVVPSSLQLQCNTAHILLKAVFSYATEIETEIFKNLLYPPPELA